MLQWLPNLLQIVQFFSINNFCSFSWQTYKVVKPLTTGTLSRVQNVCSVTRKMYILDPLFLFCSSQKSEHFISLLSADFFFIVVEIDFLCHLNTLSITVFHVHWCFFELQLELLQIANVKSRSKNIYKSRDMEYFWINFYGTQICLNSVIVVTIKTD